MYICIAKLFCFDDCFQLGQKVLFGEAGFMDAGGIGYKTNSGSNLTLFRVGAELEKKSAFEFCHVNEYFSFAKFSFFLNFLLKLILGQS